MKVAERVLETEGNLGGERVGMSIDQSALAHIMSVLTDLYSDPELAVIREYSTNALDANVEAGVKRPIEVTLPSPLSPFLRIRDHGIGLDAEGIRSIYSQYGTSTKRDSNDVVGMLGLGCKSALTYTDQFTLTSYKDGRCIQVSIGRDADGSGSMSIVADYASDSEETGTEIVIPAKRHNALEAKAHEFFSFWQEGTVLVNGERPQRVTGTWIEDGKLLLCNTISEGKIVMGNVAYPWPEAPVYGKGGYDYQTGGYKGKWQVVAFVPIGAVQFTPSREALQMTKLTKEALEAIKTDVQAKLNESLTKQIVGAATPSEALKVYQQAKDMGLSVPVDYQGRTISTELSRPNSNRDGTDSFLLAGQDGSYRGTRKTGERYTSVSIVSGKTTAWFKNFDGKELTMAKREKLAEFWRLKGITDLPQRMVFIDTLTADEKFWLGGEDVYDWTDVAAIKITRATPLTSGRPRGSYKGRMNEKWSDKIVADTIDTSKPLVWYNGNQYTVRQTNEFRLGMIPEDVTLICLEANRVEKFTRDFPMAKRLTDYCTEYVKAYLAKLDKDDLAAAEYQMACGVRLALLDASKVDDPAVKDGIAKARRKVGSLVQTLTKWQRWVTLTPTKNPLEGYALLHYRDNLTGMQEHVYIYLNAAYAAGKEKA